MNTTKLLVQLRKLEGIRPEGARLTVGEIWEGSPQVVLAGLHGIDHVDFVQRLSRANFPSDWLCAVSHADVAFAELTWDTIKGTRRTLSERVGKCKWGLSLPDVSEEDLADQGAHLIVKIDDFQTLVLLWRLDIEILNYHSLSEQPISLKSVLSPSELQRMFSACR